ncbi:MAG: hypothetical protein JRC77_07115 [Deltaproteobacteria bacterium]|nr:hypothetical protein [Deltaproteobacteria bacterium]
MIYLLVYASAKGRTTLGFAGIFKFLVFLKPAKTKPVSKSPPGFGDKICPKARHPVPFFVTPNAGKACPRALEMPLASR